MVHNRPPLGILFLEFVECLFFARSNADICKYPFVLLQLLAKPELLEHRNARDVANNMRNNAKKYWGKIVPSPVSDLQTIKQSSRSCIISFLLLEHFVYFQLEIYLFELFLEIRMGGISIQHGNSKQRFQKKSNRQNFNIAMIIRISLSSTEQRRTVS